jgi:mono/diheme cytochrome c family protein
VEVPVEPFGLAATPDDRQLLVTSIWDRTLTVLDAQTLRASFDVKVSREPRAVVVDDDGARAFVSHVVGGKLSAIDLVTDKHEVREIDLRVKRLAPMPGRRGSDDVVRGGCQGFALAKAIEAPKVRQDEAAVVGELPNLKGHAPKDPRPPRPKGRIYAPMVTVDPGDAATRSSAYYGGMFDGVAKEAPIVSVVDTEAERPLTKKVMSLGTRLGQECLLPRSAAVRGSTGTLLVTCLGVDALVELDTRGFDPGRLERRRWDVPAGPTGVAVDEQRGRAVVWSQFDAKVSVIELGGGSGQIRTTTIIELPAELSDAERAYARGRRLFHTTDDPRISSDGTACASCHPDGREDALTWATPDGPRQTLMLAGRAATTAPYGWMGKHDTLMTYVTNTFSRLGGSGVTGADLDALVTYVREMQGPVLRETRSHGDDSGRLADRGRELFFASEQGCSNCHIGATSTDSASHDIGSKASADLVTSFDTPSLHFVSGTAPYFHDGRYKTLDEVLAANDAQMGHTAQLSRRDLVALKAYLETL